MIVVFAYSKPFEYGVLVFYHFSGIFGSQGESILNNSPYDLLMNYDETGVTTAETSEQMSLGGEEYEVNTTENGWELCEFEMDSDDLRKLGIPRGTETVVVRIKKGVVLVSPAR